MKDTQISIEGVIGTKIPYDQWESEFLEWLESRNEYFGGGTLELENTEDNRTGFYNEFLTPNEEAVIDKFFDKLDALGSTDDRI